VLMIDAAPALGGEYLEPERPSSIGAYDSAVSAVFKDAFAPQVRARAIIEPSFFVEFAVGIGEDKGQYNAFVLTPSTQVWEAINSDDRMAVAGITVKRCSLPISAQLGERLVGAWRTALEDRRPRDGMNGVDGDIYHFSMNLDGHEITGQTWSPPEKSEAGRMSLIVSYLRKACEYNRSFLADIDPLIAELRNHP
jgi:hypothetical protein